MKEKIRTVTIVPNTDKEIVLRHIPSILSFLNSEKVSVLMEQRTARLVKQSKLGLPLKTLLKRTEMVLVLGGDGTFLHAASLFHMIKVPMFGINFGTVGFLNEIFYKNYKAPIRRILSGDYSSQIRMMLKVRIGNSKTAHHCLNDLIFIRHTLDPMLDMRCSVNGQGVGAFRGDGLIVSTPTGSTAYSLSANGPVLAPLVGGIIINPICAHELAIRPLVIADDEEIELDFSASKTPPYLAIDGRRSFMLKKDDRITISKSEHSIELITSRDYNYYDVLSRKLGWIR